jgi:hemerythrin
MSVTEWAGALDAGVEAIDQEHERLFVYLHELERALAAGRPDPVLEDILHDLLGYAYVHFTGEDALIAELRHCALEFRIDPRPFIACEAAAFLHDWLRDHLDRRPARPAVVN